MVTMVEVWPYEAARSPKSSMSHNELLMQSLLLFEESWDHHDASRWHAFCFLFFVFFTARPLLRGMRQLRCSVLFPSALTPVPAASLFQTAAPLGTLGLQPLQACRK